MSGTWDERAAGAAGADAPAVVWEGGGREAPPCPDEMTHNTCV